MGIHSVSSNNSKDKKTDQVTLKVAETYSKFVGRGMALVDQKVMKEMSLSPGDVIEITGKKKTYVYCDCVTFCNNTPF